MDRDIAIGVSVVALTLITMTYLVWRCRKIIDKLADTRPESIREAMRVLKDGK